MLSVWDAHRLRVTTLPEEKEGRRPVKNLAYSVLSLQKEGNHTSLTRYITYSLETI